jgi:dTDP-4-amino-4,6-dideoxygalactose transaminase
MDKLDSAGSNSGNSGRWGGASQAAKGEHVTIPLNDFKRQWEDTADAALKAFTSVGKSGWYVLGAEVTAFESAVAELWGVGHAVGVASGLDALEIALRIAGCRPGEKVLTTPLSAFATTLAIARLEAIPVFVDTDSYGLIDLERCRTALAARADIRFMLPVHLYGHALDLAVLMELRERFGCRIVEDCAQSILASSEGKSTGTAGDVAATSFYPTKNLGAMGDGGAVLTFNAEHARTARALRDYGQTAKYRHELIGYNSRLDELQAALLGRVYLPKLRGWTARRREIAAKYLKGIHHPRVQPLGGPCRSNSAWHLFPVRVAPGSKADFRRHLAAEGILSGEHYPIAIPDQAAMRGIRCETLDDCANARGLAASEVSLHPYLTDAEADRVIEACNGWEG